MSSAGVIAFRADASVSIGSGHVMRCLTLADALAAHGHACHFLCRALPGHLADAIAARGHQVHFVGGPDDPPFTPRPGDPPHAHWLPTLWETDAAQSAVILASLHPEWLIVDHYALDRRWEQAAAPAGTQIFAIDDLADRPHAAHLLLDQNLGRKARDYDGLLPGHAERLIGPAHALLRPDFAAWRSASLARRTAAVPRRLLISLGGVDADNATGRLLEVLTTCLLPAGIELYVVVGVKAPWLDAVRMQAAAMPRPTHVLVNVVDLAALMAAADLAIGAGGGTSWERCCLGLPTAILTLAANQHEAAKALQQSGAALLLGDINDSEWPARLRQLMADPALPTLLPALSGRAAALCDGAGVACVQAAIGAHSYRLRRADINDAQRIWEWRHAGGASRFYRSGADVPLSAHLEWMGKVIHDPRRLLFILQRGETPVAHLRFDLDADGRAAAISICTATDQRGRGVAAAAIRHGLARMDTDGVNVVRAEVHADNRASVALFEKAGFRQQGTDGPFLCYEWHGVARVKQGEQA